jgi:DNA-binding response OmpR family regulator
MKKVLIIEDEYYMSMILQTIFTRNFDFEVKAATGIREGFAILDIFSPDLIITDMNLGDGTAYEMLPAFVELRQKGTKVILMSAIDNDPEKKRILESDVDLFIEKPFTREKIFHSLKELHLI